MRTWFQTPQLFAREKWVLGKRNGGERNQTLTAVIANHPFTNAFVEAFSQSCLRETMSDQPIAAPTLG
ncbi:MAG: hypothetical protein QM813_16860 [Verrucomicrobiota bacterium]